MKKIILYGTAAAFFFSSTFAINRWLNVEEGGHWYWTASLRYIYVFIFLSLLICIKNGVATFKETLNCFIKYWSFWIVSGGIGFGLFYLFICYAASFSPGWVLATSWQCTILATPLVIMFLGKQVSNRGILYLIMMFFGIVLVNFDEFKSIQLIDLKSVLPIIIAAFCYPLGNTLCKYASEGKFENYRIDKFDISNNVFCQILMMTLGAFPILFLAWVIFSPPLPNTSQLYSVAFIAISTGVIATSLLYKARQLSKDSSFALAAADGTQAAEAPLALLWELAFFGVLMPSILGVVGLLLVALGIILFYTSNIKLKKTDFEL